MRRSIDLNIFKASKFRNRFRLKAKDLEYIKRNGMSVVKYHAYVLVKTRLPQQHSNIEVKHTLSYKHPVLTAQQATATCCRNCLEKWHFIPQKRKLLEHEINYIVSYISKWIQNELLAKGISSIKKVSDHAEEKEYPNYYN